MRRIWWTAVVALWLGLTAASGANAAGGPVPPQQGSAIGAAGTPYRYVAIAAGRDTNVQQLEPGAGAIGPSLRLRGQYGIPGVDYSGSTTGLSADGHTLILAQIPGASTPRRTRLIVLDAPRLHIRARLTLPGWATVDAISPDGHWLYLIQYASSDLTKYAVRAYDLRAYRLLAQPVVDPRERDEAMVGVPVTRAMGAGERWAYTLYVRPSGAPFIHALDTVGRHAVCVDLPSLISADLGSAQLGMGPGGRAVRVDLAGTPRVSVNTRTFVVTPEPVVSPVSPFTHAPITTGSAGARPSQPRSDRSGGPPWALIAVGIAVLAILVAGHRAMRRHGPDRPRDPEVATFTDLDGQVLYRITRGPSDPRSSEPA